MGRLALLPLLALVWSCGGDDGGGHPRLPEGTPIVLISIDTLRADRLPAYGYAGVETPAIDRLRQDSILFERAYSHVPLTLPSHTSAFTGLLPPDHGLRDNLGVHLEGIESLPFLPRELQQAGYATAATVSTYVLQRTAGLASGFDYYDDTIDTISKEVRLARRGDKTLERAKRWLSDVSGEPFFLFFHTYDPHTPYDPIEPYASRYADPYDGEVAFSDQVVGDLLDHLRELGVYDRALIILMSDHGEGLGDHGEWEHGVFLYSTTQHVPLMLKLPDAERGGTSDDRMAGLVDIYPTIARLVGLEVPEEVVGASLLAETPDPERRIYAETFYARAHLGWSELTSLIGRRFQFIDAPRPELYDLLADPEQQNNLIRDERQAAAEMERELSGYDRSFAPPEVTDDETRERLAALGYMSNVIDTSDGDLPDPKDRRETLRMLKEANALVKDRKFEAAIERLQRVVDTEPRMVDAHELLAKSLLNAGRPEEALASYQQALKNAQGTPAKLLLAIANVLTGLKRLDEAREHAEAVPDDAEAISLLGYLSVLEGDLTAAREYLDRAGELDGSPLKQKKLGASIALAAGDYEEAVELTRQAEALLEGYPDTNALAGVFFIRGRAEVQLGREADAERSLRREIELDSGHLQSYAHLALLYAIQGNPAESGRTLQRMVETNPTPQAYAEAVRTLRYMGDERSGAAVLQQALGRWPDSALLLELTDSAGSS